MPVSNLNVVTPTVVKKVVVGVPISTAMPPTAIDSDVNALVIQVNALQEQLDAIPPITISDTPPSNPSIGDLWIDTSN